MHQLSALITGAGRGIGRATALELAKRNYRVAMIARNRDDLEETRSLCGAESLVLTIDVTDAAAVEKAVHSVDGAFGRIDAVVHCAGLAPVRSVADMTVEEWHAVLDTNLSAAFYLCKAAWPIFARQKSGVVVNVSSAAARDPFPGFAAYGASKAGLNLFGVSAAREGQKIGVRVHTIAPSAVETQMFRKIIPAEEVPTEKTLQPDEVAAIIVQCVTGDLRYASGEVIYVHKEV